MTTININSVVKNHKGDTEPFFFTGIIFHTEDKYLCNSRKHDVGAQQK